MKKSFIAAPRCLCLLVFALFIFADFQISAQTFEPDAQTIREIIAYAKTTENNLELSRRRIVDGNNFEDKSANSYKPVKINSNFALPEDELVGSISTACLIKLIASSKFWSCSSRK